MSDMEDLFPDFDPGTYQISNGYLTWAPSDGKCTCAGGTVESSGHHEPHCGESPVVKLEDIAHVLVPKEKYDTLVAATEELVARGNDMAAMLADAYNIKVVVSDEEVTLNAPTIHIEES